VTTSIPINLAVEDDLSEAVVRKLLASAVSEFAIGDCYSKGGFGYLRRSIRGFNAAALGTPFIVLTDLDNAECAPGLMKEWLPLARNPNLLFRVAVREVEAWLIAHRDGIAAFLGVQNRLIPTDPESLKDPKQTIIHLARKSRSRDIRDDIVPPAGSTREQGPNYNGRLIAFVNNVWEPSVAANSVGSLRRALEAVNRFKPTWESDAPNKRKDVNRSS